MTMPIIPERAVPFLDGDGEVNYEWYRFLVSLAAAINRLGGGMSCR